MTTTQIIEVVIAVALIGAAIWLYRKRGPEGEGHYGSQTAVLLLIVGAIVLIHGLGLMGYSTSWGGRLGL